MPNSYTHYHDENVTDPHLRATGAISVLPLGAHEQHGPHLPFETDTLIAEGIVARLAAALPSHLPVSFLPVEPVGYSIEHGRGYEDCITMKLLNAGSALRRRNMKKACANS